METKIKSGKNKLSTSIHKPRDKGQNKLAVILPGFLDSKDYPSLVQLGKDLSKLGFTVVRFNPTGTWDSGGNMEEYSVSQYLKDIQCVVDQMVLKNNRPFKEIIVLGHSLGAMVSILYGVRNDRVSVVVAIMPPQTFVRPENFQDRVVNWKTEGFKVSTRDLPGNRSKTVEYKIPFSFVEDAMRYDALRAVSDLHKPLLLLVGDLDDLISPKHVKEIYKQANGPKKFIVLKGMGHDYRLNDEEIPIVNRHIIDFLKEHGL